MGVELEGALNIHISHIFIGSGAEETEGESWKSNDGFGVPYFRKEIVGNIGSIDICPDEAELS